MACRPADVATRESFGHFRASEAEAGPGPTVSHYRMDIRVGESFSVTVGQIRLDVAACHHRRSCSQTALIPARIS